MTVLRTHPRSSLALRLARLPALLLGATALCLPLHTTGGETDADKALLVIAPDRSDTAKPLEVQLEPLQDSYRVGEPIRFRVTGNQTFYLYLYAVDAQKGDATVLLPNKRQSGNKYEANRPATVPNREVEFFADAPGKEQVVMVASTKYLEVAAAKLRAAGDLQSGKAADLEQLFQDKGIRIRNADDSSRRDDAVVSHIELKIEGERSTHAGGGDSASAAFATPFVSTAKEQYYAGERFTVLFGADREGYVHLYAIEPGGSYALLATRKVDGKRIESLSARAEAPIGQHSIVAAYSEKEGFDEDRLAGLRGDRSGKSLRIIGDRRDEAVAVQRIEVIR